MDPSARTFGTLRSFRDSFYRCLDRRADALFELTDALSSPQAPSPRHLTRVWRPFTGVAGAASTPHSV